MEVVRDRLLDRVCKEQFTLLEAPTGFGKSTLIRQFLSKYNNITSIYLPIHSFDKHHHQFLTKLLTELRDKIGENRFTGSWAILRSKDYEPELLKDRFVKELAEAGEPLLFVFDGIEVLSDESNDFISSVVRYSSDDIFYIFASRKNITKDIQIKQRDRIELIDSDDLTFTTQEITQVFDDKITTVEGRKIRDEIGGWPFGISLVRRLWLQDIEIEQVSRLGQTKYNQIFRDRIYEPLSEEMKDFLLKTNLIESFKPEITNYLWGEKGEELLREAIDRQLFIYGDDEYGYQYHHLFGKFLTDLSHKMLSKEENKELFIELSEYYIDSGDTFNALLNAVRSGNPKALIRIVERSLDELMATTPPQDLEKILDLSEFKEDNAGILYLRFVYNYRVSKNEIAKSLLIKCWELAENNYKELTSAIIFYLTIVMGVLNERNEKLNKFLNDIPDEYSSNPYIMASLSHYYTLQHKTKKSYETLKKAIRLAEENDIKRPNLISSLYFKLSVNCHRRGDYGTSLNAAEYALDKMTENNFSRVPLLGNTVVYCLYLKRLEDAKKYLQQMPSISDETLPKHKHNIYFCRGNVYLEEWKLSEARYCFEKAIELSNIYFKVGVVILGLSELSIVLVIQRDFQSLDKVLKIYGHTTNPLKEIKSRTFLWLPLTIRHILENSLSRDTLEKMIEITDGYHNKNYANFLTFLSDIYDEELGIIKKFPESELEVDDLMIRALKRFLYNYTHEKELYEETKPEDLTIRLYLLGGLRIEINGTEITEDEWIYKRAMSLFAYMLKNRMERFTRERLIGSIWPDVSLKEGEGRFRVALRHIRKKFEELGLDDVVIYSGGVYFLNDNLNWWVDTEELEHLISIARSHQRQNELNDALTYYKMVDNLNNGDFLPNLYDEWTGNFFNYFRTLKLEVLEQICSLSVKLKNEEDFSEYSKKLILLSDEDHLVIESLNRQAEELSLKPHSVK